MGNSGKSREKKEKNENKAKNKKQKKVKKGKKAQKQWKRKMSGTLEVQLKKKKDPPMISILSVPQITYLDLFLCGTIRHNQDEPQWIVAQRLLSAPTIQYFSGLQKNCHFTAPL